ncbi:MAG: glyoxalase/bleomycin resistance/extradiol dioxygenase family protein [Croceitalea sp.]|nr:glyoxalase/bleomycin resistance/extradiol dioxygenase family protein [Croceitalea sp.]
MKKSSGFLNMIPVLPSRNIAKDIEWHKKYTGFEPVFGDHMYAGLKRDHLYLHLQWHAETEEDPLLGGSVIKLFVKDIKPVFEEFVKRGTIKEEKLRKHTDWGTHEFGFYDLNKNAIFVVQDT